MNIVPFEYEGRPVRTITINDEPWFVGRDVCAVLDLVDPRKSINLLDEDERNSVPVIDSMGREQQTLVVNEPGLYSLILRSRKPEAKAFKRWITHEVLPAIRKTGSYSVKEIGRRELAQMVIEEADRADRAEQRVAELEPKAAAVDHYMDATGLFLVGQVAKTFGMREKALRQFLYTEHVLIEHGDRRNDPMAEYVQRDYFEVKSRVVGPQDGQLAKNTTYVTPKGVEFIRRRLVSAGHVLPERSTQLALVINSA